MADIFNKDTRSRIMSRVRSKNTMPELLLRKALFARGLRYRIHVSELPGKPDIVFPRRKAIIFIHGCQWHWHGCARSRMPSTNVEYWENKIQRNRARDNEHLKKLAERGWRVLIVWECSVKMKKIQILADRVVYWVNHGVSDASF